jgi:septum formation protein
MPAPDGLAETGGPAVVLASGSAVRTRMLRQAGVPHTIDPANVDEASVRDSLLAEGAAHAAVAETLAELKAQRVSLRHPEAIVIGADQVLSCDDVLFEKPVGLDGVRGHLKSLSGKDHTLYTSAVAVRDGTVLWHRNATAVLRMRTFSETFVERYVATVGEAACESVGAYRLEEHGSHLFHRIEGDFFDILGLPMLPLLEFLRANGVIAE